MEYGFPNAGGVGGDRGERTGGGIRPLSPLSPISPVSPSLGRGGTGTGTGPLSSGPGGAISNSITFDEQQRSDQIALHFYTKLFHVVYQARAFPDHSSSGSGSRPTSSRLTRSAGSDCEDRDKDKEFQPPRLLTYRPKIDRWFNLETPGDSDLFPRELREVYKSLSLVLPHHPPNPLKIHLLLTLPDPSSFPSFPSFPAFPTFPVASAPSSPLNHNGHNTHVLVAHTQSNTPPNFPSSRIQIEPTPRFVLLETWTMSFTPRSNLATPNFVPTNLNSNATPNPDATTTTTTTEGSQDDATSENIALPTIYKHGIPLFRSLYSLLRILPAWKLFKKLRRRTPGPTSQLTIQVKATEGEDAWVDENVLAFGTPPTTGHPPLPTLTHTFPSIPHPLGSFTLSTTYLESPTFQLDDLESHLSSKFISLDEGFVPTLSATSGMTAASTANAGKQSQAESIADRFVIPPSATSVGAGASKYGPTGSGTGMSSAQYQPQAQAHFSHLRQPSLLHTTTGHSRSESYGGGSPPSGTAPLPALSRLRMESQPPYSRSHSSSPSSPSPPGTSNIGATNTGAGGTSGIPPVLPIPFPPSPSSPISSPPASSISSQPSSQTAALPIKRPSTINPFKTNTLHPGSGSSSGLGLVGAVGGGQPGSAGSIHSIHSIQSIGSLRHLTSPLSVASGGGDSFSRSPPHHSSPLSHSSASGGQLLPLPFPTQTSPRTGPSPLPPVSSGNLSPTSSLKLGQSGSGPASGTGVSAALTSPPIGIGMPTQRKRYSSSFSHRYTSSGSIGGSTGSGGSDGREGRGVPVPTSRPSSSSGIGVGGGGSSTGSGGSVCPGLGLGLGVSPGVGSSPLRDRLSAGMPSPGLDDKSQHSRSSSFLGKRTEDDDISLFMQDIEMRKPLSGRWRMERMEDRECELDGSESAEERELRHKREATDGTDSTARAGGRSVASEMTMKAASSSPTATMAPSTTESDTIGIEVVGEDQESAISDDREAAVSPNKRAGGHPYPTSYPLQPSPLSPRPRLPPTRYPPTTTQMSPQAQTQHDRSASFGQTSQSAGSRPNPARPSTSSGTSAGATVPSTSPPGSIPTSQAEVEVRLKKMNEAFLKSLAGLGEGWASTATNTDGNSRSGESGKGKDKEVKDKESEDETRRDGSLRRHDHRPGGSVAFADLRRLRRLMSQQGSEEVIGAMELGGEGRGRGGREDSLEREEMDRGRERERTGPGSPRKPANMMRYRGL